jgi:hypothetical protein
MDNFDIQKLKLKEEREKFNSEVYLWNQRQQKRSNELNKKIGEIISSKKTKDNIQQNSSLGKSLNTKSFEDEIKESNELKLEIDKLK